MERVSLLSGSNKERDNRSNSSPLQKDGGAVCNLASNEVERPRQTRPWGSEPARLAQTTGLMERDVHDGGEPSYRLHLPPGPDHYALHGSARVSDNDRGSVQVCEWRREGASAPGSRVVIRGEQPFSLIYSGAAPPLPAGGTLSACTERHI